MKKSKVYISIILAIVLLIFSYIWISLSKPALWQKKFTEQKWKTSVNEERYKLVNDLLKSDNLKDKTKAEVIEILGEPSGSFSNNSFHYLIKVEESSNKNIGIIYHILEIDLDENQNILEIRVRHNDSF